jgi:hypothetical protein
MTFPSYMTSIRTAVAARADHQRVPRRPLLIHSIDDSVGTRRVASQAPHRTLPQERRSTISKLSDASGPSVWLPEPQRMNSCGCNKTYLISFRSETTLGCMTANRAVVDGPSQSIPPSGHEFLEIRHRQRASARRAGAVLGRDALELPGDCDQARRTAI